MPLSDEYNAQLIARFTAVVRATVKGNIVIAVVQGTIGGVTFWALGIKGALLWGTLMTFLSLLPAVGSALVWVPAAAYLILTGSAAKGIVLVLVGVLVIGLIDNVLRPILVGRDTRLPDYVVLVSTLGGISIFGINGFVIGPLIAALFIAAWTLFRDEQAAERRLEREAARPRPALTSRRPKAANRSGWFQDAFQMVSRRRKLSYSGSLRAFIPVRPSRAVFSLRTRICIPRRVGLGEGPDQAGKAEAWRSSRSSRNGCSSPPRRSRRASTPSSTRPRPPRSRPLPPPLPDLSAASSARKKAAFSTTTCWKAWKNC